jgi:hypothetical protein
MPAFRRTGPGVVGSRLRDAVGTADALGVADASSEKGTPALTHAISTPVASWFARDVDGIDPVPAPPPASRSAPAGATRVVVSALRGWAGRALRLARWAGSLLRSDGLVARRYTGPLGGSEGSEWLRLLYVGQPEHAREFELYYRSDACHCPTPSETVFAGGLLGYLFHRGRIARAAAEADVVAHQVFPGALRGEGDLLHHPMLRAGLDVERSLVAQIRRMRSRAQRRLARAVLREAAYRSWVASGAEAFEYFRSRLYEPFVLARFGRWGKVADAADLRRLHLRMGQILFVARRDRPTEPVCGALLLDTGVGEIAYCVNGFAAAEVHQPLVMAERTAALELALLGHAIQRGARRLDLGYTRAILNDGLFAHKRRLGCTFTPIPGSPRFRVRVRPTRRAAVFARYPLLVATPGGWQAVLGYDQAAPRPSARAVRGAVKGWCRALRLASTVVWSLGCAAMASDPRGEETFRRALQEADPRGTVHFLVDGAEACAACPGPCHPWARPAP